MDENSFYLKFSQFLKDTNNSDSSTYFSNSIPHQYPMTTPHHENNSLGEEDFKAMKTILTKKSKNSCIIDLLHSLSLKVKQSLHIMCNSKEIEHLVNNMGFIVAKFVEIVNEYKQYSISNTFVITAIKNTKKSFPEFFLSWSEDDSGDIQVQDSMWIEEHCLLLLVVDFKNQLGL